MLFSKLPSNMLLQGLQSLFIQIVIVLLKGGKWLCRFVHYKVLSTWDFSPERLLSIGYVNFKYMRVDWLNQSLSVSHWIQLLTYVDLSMCLILTDCFAIFSAEYLHGMGFENKPIVTKIWSAEVYMIKAVVTRQLFYQVVAFFV